MNDDGPKIVQLPEHPSKMAAANEQLKRDLEPMIQNQMMLAKIRRAAFLAYVSEGFTEQQAMELCCK